MRLTRNLVLPTTILWTICLTSMCYAQTLTWLGTIGGYQSYASDISLDGSVCVGWSYTATGVKHAFRWNRVTGLRDLGTLPYYTSASGATGTSAHGEVIVGWSEHRSGVRRAFYWTSTTGMQTIGTLGGSWSVANAVTPDGQTVVGEASTTAGVGHAFLWRPSGGIQDLGTLGGSWSGALNISADGSTVVGSSYIIATDREYHACRWRLQQNTIEDLDTLGGESSQALASSWGGNVIVGWSHNEAGLFRAFRWEPVGEIQALPILTNTYYSRAYDVNHDGSLIVGSTTLLNTGTKAVRWQWGIGVENLNVTYANLLTDGSVLEIATAITPDGRYIAGMGIHATTHREEAFVLDTWRAGDTNGDGCVDDTDLLNVLFAFGTPGTDGARHEDINKDGTVDDADLLVVLFNFGTGC